MLCILFGIRSAISSSGVKAATCGPTTNFITTWKTDNPGTSNSTSITIPGTGSGYNYQVDWNNDGVMDETITTSSHTHDFGAAGTYTIQICGNFPRIYFNGVGDRQKILSVDQWGNNGWTSMEEAFRGASNLDVTATDVPDLLGVTSMLRMFLGTTSLTGNSSFGEWDVSNVTTMNSAFYGATSFNQPIGEWSIGNVLDISWMFYNATSFNQPIGEWDVSNVTNMSGVFSGATSFNQPIGEWDVSNVTNMYNVFSGATSFNQPIGEWDVSNVTTMTGVFSGATSFNQPIGEWDVSNVTTMTNVFFGATSFNQPIGEWDVSNVTTMHSAFTNATSFNQPIGEWDVSNVTTMTNVFYGATSFNQPIGEWDVSNVTTMNSAFTNATSFNQPIGEWDVSNVTTMYNVFYNANSFSMGNYDTTLIGWASRTLQQGITLTFHTYCMSETARQYIIDTYSWVIPGSKDCSFTLNNSLTVTLPSNPSAGTVAGVLSTNVSVRAEDPYTIACAASGADDEFFTISGASDNELVLTTQLDSAVPLDQDGDGNYEVCVRATNESGHTLDQLFSVRVPIEKKITGVSFSQQEDKKIMTIQGVAFFDDPSEIWEGLTRSLVTLNGVPLKFCTEGIGYTAAEIEQLGYDPAYFSDTPLCYFLAENNGSDPAITPTSAKIWLPDNFNIDAEGTVSVNGSSNYTFNATIPTVAVNGNKPIAQNPIIPKRPTFSGVATPGATVEVTVHSDPITCSTVADSSGNWSCTLPSDLEPGNHTVNVTVTYPDSSTATLGPYQVQVSSGGTIIDNNTPLAPNAGVGRVEQTPYALVALISITLSTVVITHILLKSIKAAVFSREKRTKHRRHSKR